MGEPWVPPCPRRVARSVRVGEVPSSNLGTPINTGETMFAP